MLRRFLILSFVCFLSSYGCSKQPNVKKELKVDNCSYVDEYFDYCKIDYLKKYEKIFNEENINFNNKLILVPVVVNGDLYSGIVAIDKYSGHVDTMLFGFKINGKNDQIISNINSDIFCIVGEINSKSLSVTKKGKNCFKYNHKGFELIDQKKDKKDINKNIFPIIYDHNKFKCGNYDCYLSGLTINNLNKISREDTNTELKFLVNEKGFDTSYIDASDNNGILYVIRYNEGEGEEENLYLSYFLGGEFKTKLLGPIKSLKILDSRNILFNGKRVVLE